MFFDVKKIFDSFYKKNKALTVAAVFIVTAMLFEIVIYEISRTISLVDVIQDDVERNSFKIGYLEGQIDILINKIEVNRE